jgi:N-hydroxyarylamine O-acetyltransferase
MPYTDEQLGAYFGRIRAGEATSSYGALAEIQRAHRLSIPFENFDIHLGRGISLDPRHLFDKLVRRRRGGYCFEQNALLLGMLQSLGFEARPLLARVWLNAVDTPPRTHTLNLVHIEGEDFIADAGFGGSFVPPLPLVADEVVTTPDGARHRLARTGEHGWMLQRDPGSGWARQYSFTTDKVWPADLEAANHWTATRPGTRFTTLRLASATLPDGYLSLSDRTLTVTRMGVAEAREIGDAEEYRRTLGEKFDLTLSASEVAALALFDLHAPDSNRDGGGD